MGIRFDATRWHKLRLQDDRNAARRANDDVRPQCRLAEDALLLYARVIAPARMLGPQHIQQPDIEGDFASSGRLNIQLNPLWVRPCDFPIRGMLFSFLLFGLFLFNKILHRYAQVLMKGFGYI